MQLVIHAPFGARINRAWGLSLRKRFCRTFQFRAAGGGHRQRHRDFARRAAQLSARARFQFPERRYRRRCPDSGAAGLADVHRAMALECLAGPRRPAFLARAERFRRRFNACGPTTCWPPSSRIRRRAATTSWGRKFRFPIIRSSTKRFAIACTKQWTSMD